MAVYFVSSFGIDLKQSAWFMLMIPSIGLVGRLAYSHLMRFTGDRENIVSIYGFIVCIVSCVILTFEVASPLLAALCLSITYAAISLINTSSVSIYPMRFAQTGNVAAVSGIMDFATYLGAGIGSAVYGYTIEWFGYGAMFGSWVVLSAISMAVLAMNERRSRMA
jgi:predicted MFS family arabinose efflux permease